MDKASPQRLRLLGTECPSVSSLDTLQKLYTLKLLHAYSSIGELMEVKRPIPVHQTPMINRPLLGNDIHTNLVLKAVTFRDA